MKGKKTTEKDYWDKIDKTSTCWNWKGTLYKGYGSARYEGKRIPIHRIIYELLIGKIPEGLQIDHLCRNRKCVNPGHLEPVTKKENILRGNAFSAINARKTHCSKGHIFSDTNTIKRRGRRFCKKCKNIYNAKWISKKRNNKKLV